MNNQNFHTPIINKQTELSPIASEEELSPVQTISVEEPEYEEHARSKAKSRKFKKVEMSTAKKFYKIKQNLPKKEKKSLKTT